jgi:hypothetical protein
LDALLHPLLGLGVGHQKLLAVLFASDALLVFEARDVPEVFDCESDFHKLPVVLWSSLA